MSSIDDIIKRLRENKILAEKNDYAQSSVKELVDLAQNGDQLAVETLINTHKDFLNKMTAKYFLASGDKEDVMQVAMIAFWKAIMDWNGSGDFEAYAGMLIKRALSDEIRKEEAGKSQINTLANSLDDTLSDDGEGGGQTVGDTIPSNLDSPEDVAAAHELEAAIDKYLEDTFTEKEREVIQKYIEGYKVSEIAEVLDMPYKRAENILYVIKSKLKEYLKNNSYRESKKIREGRGIEFSDEEKKILKESLDRIEKKRVLESKVALVKESYENYTESQLDLEIEEIEARVEEIRSELSRTHYDDRYELESELDDIKARLLAMEDYTTDEQYKKIDDLSSEVKSAYETEYEGEVEYVDPYEERGLRRSDFY